MKLFRSACIFGLLALGMSGSVVQAQQATPVPMAHDGRHLLRETPAIQSLFKSVWGSSAEARWVAEHNAFLAGGQPLTGPRLAYLNSNTSVNNSYVGIDAFVAGLREQGYEPGRTIAIDWRYSEGRVDALPALAADIVATKPDLILGAGTTETDAVKKATSTIPIVMVSVSDPLAARLVASFEHPGGNITGLTNTPVDIFGKRLQALNDAIPGLNRVAILRFTPNPSTAGTLAETRQAAERLGLEALPIEINRVPEDLAGAFEMAAAQHADGVVVLPEATINANRARVAELAVRYRLPVMAPARVFAEAGVLMAYGPAPAENPRRAAEYVAKILRGSRPADLPVGISEEAEFLINLKTADAIGLSIPAAVLAQASEVLR